MGITPKAVATPEAFDLESGESFYEYPESSNLSAVRAFELVAQSADAAIADSGLLPNISSCP